MTQEFVQKNLFEELQPVDNKKIPLTEREKRVLRAIKYLTISGPVDYRRIETYRGLQDVKDVKRMCNEPIST